MLEKIKIKIKNNILLYRLALPIIILKRILAMRSFKDFDRLFSNTIGGSIIVSVNNIPGKFEIDSRSHILREIMVKKVYEPEIVNKISKNAIINKDAINVGANIGLYANLLAKLIDVDRKVLAIEPTPGAFKLLERNIKINNYSEKIIAFNGIATDTPGLSKINFIEGREEYSSVGVISHFAVEKENYSSVNIEGETIDNLVVKFNLKPGIIVMDVEGFEFQVLKGSMKTINRFKPIIISELDDNLLKNLNHTAFQIIELLEMNGYTITDVENNKLTLPFKGGNIIAHPI